MSTVVGPLKDNPLIKSLNRHSFTGLRGQASFALKQINRCYNLQKCNRHRTERDNT